MHLPLPDAPFVRWLIPIALALVAAAGAIATLPNGATP